MNPIEALIRAENWVPAGRAIRHELIKDPTNHWLLTRMSLTFYERHDYRKALVFSQRAFAADPECPLVLWDYAGTLQMLGRHRDAIEIHRKLIRRGPKKLASGSCGEGLARARGLVADCHYRVSNSMEELGLSDEALGEFERHLDMRGPGCQSIYTMSELNVKRAHLKNEKGRRAVPDLKNSSREEL